MGKKDPEKAARLKEKKAKKEEEAKQKQSREKVEAGRLALEPAEAKTAPNYTKAIASFEEALASWPENFEAYALKGHALREQKNYDQAIEDYSNCLQLNDACVQAYEGRACCHEAQKNWGLAIQDYSQMLEIQPQNDHAYNMRGNALLMTREPGWRLRKDDLNRVIEDFNASIRCNEYNYFAHCNLGRCYDEHGEREKAIECFTRALHLKDDYLYAAYRRACSALALVDDARRQAEEGVEEAITVVTESHQAVPPAVPEVTLKATNPNADDAANTSSSMIVDEKAIEAQILAELDAEKRNALHKRLLTQAVHDFTRLINPEELEKELPSLIHRGTCYFYLKDFDKSDADFKAAEKTISNVPSSEFNETAFGGTPAAVLKSVVSVKSQLLKAAREAEKQKKLASRERGASQAM